METELIEELKDDFVYSHRSREVIEDELFDEFEELLEDNEPEEVRNRIMQLSSDEFEDFALSVLDEVDS